MSARGSDLINDAIASSVPKEVAHPHGSNAFALDDGVATEDPTAVKRLSVDVKDIESIGDRTASVVDHELYPLPTPEEVVTLRKVADTIPMVAYSLCIVELAERASYYGVQTVFSNFMQFPLPKGGNGAGAPARGTQDTAGALGKGEQFSVAIGLLFLFLAYVIPIFSGYAADVFTGRFRMIMYGVLVCGVAHIIMICGAIPSVLQAGNGIAPFMISLFLLAIGAGMFKPCVAPTVIDQYTHQRSYTKVLKTGEKVIVDPEVTIQRIMLVFYGCINIGAFFAIATTYSEKYVGYWLAFLTPGIVYFLLPLLLIFLNKRIVKKPASGSALQNVLRITGVAIKQSRGQFWKKDFWQKATPSALREKGITTYNGQPIPWTEKNVDDVVRTIKACAVFLYFPIYNINDGGIGSVATSQGAAMTTNGAPNDLLNNFNPLTIIVTVPFLSYVVYPSLRKANIKFGRISRMTFGFTLAAISGMCGAVVQYYIYKTSPCGYAASTCDSVSPISIWVQLPNTMLGAISECFCNVTAYELAYSRAPEGMQTLVMALFLFSTALSNALGEVISPAIADPHLIWVWGGPAIALAVQTVIFWFRYKHLNNDEFMTYEDQYGEGQEGSEVEKQHAIKGGEEAEKNVVHVPDTISEEDAAAAAPTTTTVTTGNEKR